MRTDTIALLNGLSSHPKSRAKMIFGNAQQLRISRREFNESKPPPLIPEQTPFWKQVATESDVRLEDLLDHARLYLAMFRYEQLCLGGCPFMFAGPVALCSLRRLLRAGLQVHDPQAALHVWAGVMKTSSSGGWKMTATELTSALSLLLPVAFLPAVAIAELVQDIFDDVRGLLHSQGACVVMCLNWALLPTPQPVRAPRKLVFVPAPRRSVAAPDSHPRCSFCDRMLFTLFARSSRTLFSGFTRGKERSCGLSI